MSQVNKEQVQKLSSFMEKNPDMARNYNGLSSNGRATQRLQWEKLTRALNACGPPTKTVAEWKRIWSLRKYSAKKKLSHNKMSLKQTGGGPFDLKKLDEVDEAIVAACGMEASVSGISGAVTFGSSARENLEDNNSESELQQLLNDLTETSNEELEGVSVLKDKTNTPSTNTPSTNTPLRTTPRRQIRKQKTEDNKENLLKQQIELQKNYFADQLEHSKVNNEVLTEIKNVLKELVEVKKKQLDVTLSMKKDELELRKKELEVAKLANQLKSIELNLDEN